LTTLDANQQAELEKPVTRFVYFVEFDFRSATLYLSSVMQNITWGGHEWTGLGGVAAISPIDAKQGTAAQSLTFQLNISTSGFLALGVGDVAEYRGRDAKLYFCPLDEQYRMIGTPVACWRGTMDTMVSNISGKQGETTGTISLKCETSAYGLKRQASLRMNAAQQKQRYPTDTGFAFLTQLIADPGVWVSKRFQQR